MAIVFVQNGNSDLHVAALNGDCKAVDRLLMEGMDFTAKNKVHVKFYYCIVSLSGRTIPEFKDGKLPVDLAREHNRSEAEKRLSEWAKKETARKYSIL